MAIFFIQDFITGGGRSGLLAGKEPPTNLSMDAVGKYKKNPNAIGDFLSLDVINQDSIMIQTWTDLDSEDGIGLLINI